MNILTLFTLLCLSCSGSGTKTDTPTPTPTPTPVTHYVSSAADLTALGTLSAGTTVVWRNGTYTDQIVTVKGNGTSANPVIVKAETAGGVHFMGTSRMAVSGKQVTLDGFWWQNPTPVSGKSIITVNKDADSCTVTHCAITGFGLTEDNVTDTKWVSLYGTHHTVANCSFSDKRNMGTLLVVWFETSVVPSHTIRNNYFSRPATLLDTDGSPKNGQESIRIGTSDYSMQEGACRVEGNYFYHCHGEQAEIISNKSCKNLYTGNLVVESKGSITMRHGNNCTVENNIILGNQMEGTGGIRLIGEGHRVENNYLEGLAGTGYCTGICLVRGEPNAVASGYWQVKQATVIGNTLVDCRYAFHVNYGARTTQTLPVISTTIQNNVVSLSSSSMYAVKCYTSPEPEITWQNNTLYGGKQEGISLTTVSQQPTISAPTQRATAIRQAAGCGYTLQ